MEMDDSDEMFVSNEERDEQRLEGILRHSSRRQETPVMLVQLPPAENPMNAEFPLAQRRVTIVNTAGAAPTSLEERVDPFEWHFRRNTPDLRTSLGRQGAEDELSSRRKSKIGGLDKEQLVIQASIASIGRYPIMFEVVERTSSPLRPDSKSDSHARPEKRGSDKLNNGQTIAQAEGTDFDNDDVAGDDMLPALDRIMSTMHNVESEDKIVANNKSADEKLPPERTERSNEVTVMPAQYSFADQNSPFVNKTKGRDELKPKPSSRVRVFIMLDEWDDGDSLEKEIGKHRYGTPGDGETTMSVDTRDENRKEYVSDRSPLQDKRVDRSGRGGRPGEGGGEGAQRGRKGDRGGRYGDGRRAEDDYDDGSDDGNRRKGRRRPGDDDDAKRNFRGRRRQGQDYDDDFDDDDGRRRGKRPGDRDYDKKRYGDGRNGQGYDDDLDDDDGRRSGKRPGDRDYDKKRYGDGRNGEGYDDYLDDDDGRKSGKRPGDRDYDKKRYGDGRPGQGYDDDIDDDDGRRSEKRPGDKDYDKRRYGDGRPGQGYDDDLDDDDGRRRAKRPGDRDYNKRRYGDGSKSDGPDKGPDGRTRSSANRKGRPGGDTDGQKYRVVTMPKSATTLTSKRRYHIQVTDHNMKEPWFNSRFNISKENNVDLNYEGPVKITPYYVGDKFQ